jgi:serine protease Do
MGYYDNEYEAPERNNRSGRYGRGRGVWFFSGLLGALVGIIIFFIASPYLASQGLLPTYTNSTNGTQLSGNQTPGNANTQNVTVNLSDAVVNSVDNVSPAVVAVINMQNSNSGLLQSGLQETGIGSGIIYKKSGQYAYVVTNDHVVSGADKLEVQFDDNTKITGTLLGADSLYDLAVVRIPSAKVTKVATFGDSNILKRGEPVVAIGNPLGFSGSVTEGIVSANNRTIPRTVDTQGGQVQYNAQVIQTDAAINPGNSGGALINIDGQVIGINSLKISESSVEGIGFAIPINVAKPVITQLETTGKVERPFMGVGLQDLAQIPSNYIQKLNIPSNVKSGLVVIQVSTNSPATKAGLKQGDVIVSVNGHQIQDYVDFSTYLYSNLHVGQTIKIEYYRGGTKHSTQLKLGGKVFS